MAPAPSAARLTVPLALRAAPRVIEPDEPAAVLMLAEPAVMISVLLTFPFALRVNTLPLEAARLTEPVSVTLTLALVLTDKLDALVCIVMAPLVELRTTEAALILPVISPEPSALRLAELVALTAAPSKIDPPEPLVVLRLTILPERTPLVLIVAAATRLKLFPLDAAKFTEPLSVKVTFPELLALRLPALVWTLMTPDPDPRTSEAALIFPLMLPAPSALNVAELEALRFVPSVIEPADPVVVVSTALLAVKAPARLILPAAVSANVLPLDATRLAAPLSVNVTFPDVFAARLPAFV